MENNRGNSGEALVSPWLREALNSLATRIPQIRLWRIDQVYPRLNMSQPSGIKVKPEHISDSNNEGRIAEESLWSSSDDMGTEYAPSGTMVKQENVSDSDSEAIATEEPLLSASDDMGAQDARSSVMAMKNEETTRDLVLKFEEVAEDNRSATVKSEAESSGTKVEQEQLSDCDSKATATEELLLCVSDDMRAQDAQSSVTVMKNEEASGDLMWKFEEVAEDIMSATVKSEAETMSLVTFSHQLEQSQQTDVEPRSYPGHEHFTDTEHPARPGTEQNASNLQKNKKSQHQRQFCCDVCEKSFTQRGSLNIHMHIHTGHRPVSCEICNKSFVHRGNLNLHMRSHTGVRPFSCDVCNKSFTRSHHLINHIRTHTGQRQFSCDICNKSFAHRGNLNVHMRTHTGVRPFSCDICNKSYTQRGYLNSHMRTHTGERPFSCEICNKSYTTAVGLKHHFATHTGQRQFSCDIL